MNVVSFPFRFDGSGRVATVEQGSDPHSAELIAALLVTRVSERDLCPDFGVTDMVGHGLDGSELEASVAAFGPDVDLTDVDITAVTDGTQLVRVSFE